MNVLAISRDANKDLTPIFIPKNMFHWLIEASYLYFIWYLFFQDLMQSVNEGQKKKDLAAARVNMAKAVLPHAKQAELEKQKKKAEKDWNDLVDLIDKTK